MSEKRIKVEVFKEIFICNECGQGELIFTGMQLGSNPPLNWHKCTHCGKEFVHKGKIYPCLRWEDAEVPKLAVNPLAKD